MCTLTIGLIVEKTYFQLKISNIGLFAIRNLAIQ